MQSQNKQGSSWPACCQYCRRHSSFLYCSSKSLCLCQNYPSCNTHMRISIFLSEQTINIKINPRKDLSPSVSMNISISGSIIYLPGRHMVSQNKQVIPENLSQSKVTEVRRGAIFRKKKWKSIKTILDQFYKNDSRTQKCIRRCCSRAVSSRLVVLPQI